MSSLKRKDAPAGAPSSAKAAKTSSSSTPSKKSKSDKPTTTNPSAKKSDAAPKPSKASAAAPAVSRLKDEEPLFPRGGGSVLSPMEQKQISIQAKQDVLFENQSGKSSDKKAERASKKKKSKFSKDSKSGSKSQPAEDAIKIESLNYKRLVKGSLVLGQVVEVNALDLTLALPNNLIGHVPITAVSETLNERIAAEAEAEDEEEEGDDEDSNLSMNQLFRVGQYVRAYVTSTIDESTASAGKPKRHIELSLRSDHANTGLSNKEIVPNATVMATVISAEDHGFVLDLGLDGSMLQGFLPRKELASDIPESYMQPGNVLLCLVASKSTNGKVAQLTTLPNKIGRVQNYAAEATTINTFLPGSAVEVMVSEISPHGLAGKVMGSLDVTADLVHSGLGPQDAKLETDYKIGQKFKARVICNFPAAKDLKLGVSVLDHVMNLKPKHVKASQSPVEVLPISSVVEKCTVTKVEAGIGLFVDIGIEGVPGFVHISRVKDGKVDMLSSTTGSFKTGSVHRGRVLGYNPVDAIFQLSFEQRILEQPFLRIEDIPVGEVVNGEVEKILIGQDGVSGLLVTLAEGITGFVPEMHISDVRLQHPERKYREGLKVKARVLSKDTSKRQVRLTLKKTLVNSEAKPLQSFQELVMGMQVPGTVISVNAHGAIVQFYGTLRGYLPVSEMSEAYIPDPKEHFRAGQVVNVHVLNFDADTKKLIVSCKDPSAFGLDKQSALKKLSLGAVVSAKVVQKTEDDVFVELVDSSLKAMISSKHLSDKPSKRQQALNRIRVGQTLNDLVVLEKNEGRRSLVLSKKPNLVKAAQECKLLASVQEAKVGELRQGFVRNITVTAAFVQFAGQVIALLPKSKLPLDDQKTSNFGLEKFQSLAVKIASVDKEHNRLVVASPSFEEGTAATKETCSTGPAEQAQNPVDGAVSSMDDVVIGKVVKAEVVSIKNTQINVKLADNIQGRVDMSQAFDKWSEIANPKAPLDQFKKEKTIKVRVLGTHDAKNHRFLPITHRSTHSLIELSAKPSSLSGTYKAPAALEDLKVGSSHIAFINKIQPSFVWVNITPNVRGRLSLMELSDDVSQLDNVSANFPIGSALRVRVLGVDTAEGRLDLSARSAGASANLKWEDVKQNMVVPGRITKINERQIMVQLSDIVSGPLHLIDTSDDYDEASTMSHSRNGIIRVSVVNVDKSNKKIRFSARPSRVLNSSLPVKDREITGISQLSTGDIVRGFVKNVADKGLFVNLGGDVTAMVRISDLSDKFLKDWKDSFQIDQLVKGRIISVDPTVGHVQMSLKPSVVDKKFVPLKTYTDLQKGQIVTGTVRKVEDFGAFILLDGSNNVSGLCHRSEMAEKPVEDVRKLLKEGDAVKALILSVDAQKRRVSFGLKPSYFEDEDSDMSDGDDDAGAALVDSDDNEDSAEADDSDDDMEDAGVTITGTDNGPGSDDDSDMLDDDDEDDDDEEDEEIGGLDAGGFDWSADALDKNDQADADAGQEAGGQDKKKKRRKAQIEVDKSGDLDAFGPRTAVDYEQLLNRQPNSSELWIQYMAHQMQVSELAKARDVVERAVRTINSSEETEKLNAWVAFLNLEVRFGNEETVDDVFKRACQVNDPQEVYQRLATIYIHEEKNQKADDLFQTMTKKFGASSPGVWHNYAHWLHSVRGEPERARALVGRATQALPGHARLALMTRFAALEYTSAHRDPERGRTAFEGLLAAFPKRMDLWGQLLDHEMKSHDGAADPAVIRDIFDRAVRSPGVKARAAKKWFKRWADWESAHGDAKGRERVSARAAEWVRAREEAKARQGGGDEDEDEE